MKHTLFILFFLPLFVLSQVETLNVSQVKITKNKYLKGTFQVTGYSKKKDTLIVYWKNIPILKRKIHYKTDIEIRFEFYEIDNISFKLKHQENSNIVATIYSSYIDHPVLYKPKENEQIQQYTVGRSK